MEVKHPTTYEEQVALLEEKGFFIPDKEECINFLKRANYYRLSAYLLPYRKPDHSYFSGISFERIIKSYDFDSEIRAILFRAIEEIELYSKTQFSYYLGHAYGALGYLDDSIFNNRHNANAYHNNLKNCITENETSLVVKHHNEVYEGNFPIWVIIEYFSMGNLSYLYSDLKTKDRKSIAQESFSTSEGCLKSWLRCLTELRNKCAHYSRLYYWKFKSIPKNPQNAEFIFDQTLFSQILMLKYLYPDKNNWNANIYRPLLSTLARYEGFISLKHIGFPSNWKDLLKSEQPLGI